jgi:hypothetical protein
VGVRFVVIRDINNQGEPNMYNNGVHAEDKFLDAEQALLYIDEYVYDRENVLWK